MKLIIFEGVDRTGKDTFCKFIIDNSKKYIIRHWGFPKGKTNEEKIRYQKYSFKKEFDFYNSLKKDKYFFENNDYLIWNRSHIGELVYGRLYRNYNPDIWIYNIESLYGFDIDKNIYLILLHTDPNFIIKQDDGKSFTKKIDMKKREIELFEQAFEKSIIQNKLKITINKGNEYRNKEELKQELFKFVKINNKF